MIASTLSQKTPISLLQEYCARNGSTPEYKLLSVEGVVHAPTFMYRVQVGDIYATGTGQSKKKAKHAAAKAILPLLFANPSVAFGTNSLSTSGDEVDITASVVEPISSEICEVVVPQDDGISENPVGKLQEWCMKNHRRPPFYETTNEQGPPHERTFVITCYVDKFQKTGTGKSKRLAKRQAAHEMLEYLQSHPVETDENNENGSYNGSIPLSFNNGCLGIEDIKVTKCDASHSQQLQDFIRNLQSVSDNKMMSILHNTPLNEDGVDYVNILKKLSEEQEFEVFYKPIEDRGLNNMFQCLVQLGSLPVAVCCGSGPLPEKAQQDAAHTALEYLKIMTKTK